MLLSSKSFIQAGLVYINLIGKLTQLRNCNDIKYMKILTIRLFFKDFNFCGSKLTERKTTVVFQEFLEIVQK